jgi:hypothetical protein
MQKLKKTTLSLLKSQQGSAIVGVVALSIVTAIAGAGYLQYTANAFGQEVRALEETKAFYAAESGLLLGARWLTIQDPDSLPASGTVITIAGGLTINTGITVAVKDSLGANDTAFITSIASSATLPYIKTKLSWVVAASHSGGGSVDTFTFSHWREENSL